MKIVKIHFAIIKKALQYKVMIDQIQKSNFRKLLLFSLLIVFIGQLGNIVAINKFPAFTIYQMFFLTILYIVYYSIYFFNCKLAEFDALTAGEENLIGPRFYCKSRRLNNINWLYSSAISLIILVIIAFLLQDYVLDVFMRIYCYSALFVIVFLSTIGYTQFVTSVYLILKISNTPGTLKKYNKMLPYNTEWVKTLSDMAYKGSSMFFFVGLFYILLFYGFCFSGLFNIDMGVTTQLVLIISFWIGIIIFIVVAFPLLLSLSILSINNIVLRLKNQRAKNIQLELRHFQDDILLKYLHMNILISLDNTPNSPEKPILSSIASVGIGAINFFASVQACLSLLNVIQ